MGTVAISLDLNEALKARVEAAAAAAGKTPHAFMVEAIEKEVARAERDDAFADEALEAEREMQRGGEYFAAGDVFRYVTARAEGKPARHPKPRRLRK